VVAAADAATADGAEGLLFLFPLVFEMMTTSSTTQPNTHGQRRRRFLADGAGAAGCSPEPRNGSVTGTPRKSSNAVFVGVDVGAIELLEPIVTEAS
jgi:hypothetical protein